MAVAAVDVACVAIAGVLAVDVLRGCCPSYTSLHTDRMGSHTMGGGGPKGVQPAQREGRC